MIAPTTCGLLYKSEFPEVAPATIPLTGVSVHAVVKGHCSRVTVTQSYENTESKPLEAVYVFPLEEGCAVCGFSVTIGDRRIAGKVLSRDEAFDLYDDSMVEGHGAFLLDQERPNIFTASVGNILPGQKVGVEISYVAELSMEGDGVRLMIPTTVSPRYVPESHRNFEGLTGGERVNPPVSQMGVPYSLDLKVEVDLLSPLGAVESPSHKIRAEIDGSKAVITLAGDEGALDRDFVLLLRAADSKAPTSYRAVDDQGDGYVSATFVPDIPVERKPVEVVFVVDCSGSMGGPSMEEARRTLLLCLQSLSEGDNFNIVRFGSTYERLFPKSVAYNDVNLEKARKYANAMDADLGGTEILAPLQEILEEKARGELDRRVVLLTDGEVSNENDVINLAGRHKKAARVFAFGIGAGSSEFLIRGLARASGGAAEFVYPGEKIEDKVLRHFDRITLNAATDFKLRWKGLKVEHVTPADPPALAPGEAVTFIGKISGGMGAAGRAGGTHEPAGSGARGAGGGSGVSGGRGASGASGPSRGPAAKAILSYLVGGKKAGMESSFKRSPAAGKDTVLPMIWARRRIRELEEGNEWTRRGSRQSERVKKSVESQLVDIGKRYGLMSSATSYVAIEERPADERATERAELRRIPVALTTGWGGLMGAIGPVACAPMASMRMLDTDAMLIQPDSVAPQVSGTGAFSSGPADMVDSMSESVGPGIGRGGVARKAKGSPDDKLDDVLFAQRSDGSWELTKELARLCNAKPADLKKAAKTESAKVSEPERLLATLLVLQLLEARAEATSLKPMIRKAKAWAKRAVGKSKPPKSFSSWEEWAARFVVK